MARKFRIHWDVLSASRDCFRKGMSGGCAWLILLNETARAADHIYGCSVASPDGPKIGSGSVLKEGSQSNWP